MDCIVGFVRCLSNACGEYERHCTKSGFARICEEAPRLLTCAYGLSTNGLTTALISSIVVGDAATVFCAYSRCGSS